MVSWDSCQQHPGVQAYRTAPVVFTALIFSVLGHSYRPLVTNGFYNLGFISLPLFRFIPNDGSDMVNKVLLDYSNNDYF